MENKNGDKNNATPPIRLILQFQVERKGAPLQKRTMVDLESGSSKVPTNPIQLINRTTAAILGSHGDIMQGNDRLQQRDEGIKGKLKGFTSREMDVLTHLMNGATNVEIAKLLGVSPNTIKYHVKNILQKLHVKNRVELAAKFYQL